MKNPYYVWWIDSIVRFRKHNPKRQDWKSHLFIFNTWANAMNLMIIFLWLKYFNILNIPQITLNILPGTIIDKALSVIVEYATPFALLNYFLIFHKNRYEKFIEKHKDTKHNYAVIYGITITILFFITLCLYGYLTGQM